MPRRAARAPAQPTPFQIINVDRKVKVDAVGLDPAAGNAVLGSAVDCLVNLVDKYSFFWHGGFYGPSNALLHKQFLVFGLVGYLGVLLEGDPGSFIV